MLALHWHGREPLPAEEIAERLSVLHPGVTMDQVRARAGHLRWKRPREFVSFLRSRTGCIRLAEPQEPIDEDKPLLAGPWPKDAPWFTDHPGIEAASTPKRMYGDPVHGMRCSAIATAAGEHA